MTNTTKGDYKAPKLTNHGKLNELTLNTPGFGPGEGAYFEQIDSPPPVS